MNPRFIDKYKNEVVPHLKEEFSYSNVMEVPRIVKVVVNVGVGEAKTDTKYMDSAIAELRAITGQQPLMKRAKKSIAGFKLRQGMPVGCKVTLRGAGCGSFRSPYLIGIADQWDFQGVSRKGFDGRGNYNLG